MKADDILHDRVAELIAAASNGTVTTQQASDTSSNLLEKGFTSLSFLQLIDAVENEFGLYIDLEEDTTFLGSVDGIVGFIHAQQAQ
ncbi:phosphopantetheine-binding protein [Micromonospora sp. NBC_00617]|uniref:phosphopantetheine-binding protein n=1 Tax=Micromonospora sp. NBC_00617 TaxID=2903587 RepID=UPI0030DF35B2